MFIVALQMEEGKMEVMCTRRSRLFWRNIMSTALEASEQLSFCLGDRWIIR